ncbi:HlyD family secretion protein [Entomomonas asaccharolytica]|uniref:HlyD family efflux transporter periplasmic adaptor subunit n=1 Tax=Entomomonas asaccharolytica TaxID=2785331 RepID=A0A974NI48_9GAMM|nr:HlyD family efflux transporter periplasmic adaptor subunit [Entomomonas asaccharolytica]QQP86978.1 HlyD family efflux transporter periplasmic adaptor subunit [Entomomonas asaccharolytica]
MTTETSEAVEKTEKKHKKTPLNPSRQRRKWLLILTVVVVVAILLVILWYLLYGQWYESTDDAYVNGNIVQVTPLVSGTVVSIGADDGDLVQQGQTLVSLDPNDTEIALQQAAANLANTVRKVRSLYSTVDSFEAQLKSSQAGLQKAQEDFNRRQKLIAQGAISREELSHALTTLQEAQANVINIKQQLQSNKVLVDNTVLRTHPDVLAAATQFEQAYLNQLRSNLTAPVSGFIAKRSVQVGQHVEKGSQLMAIIPLHQVWVDANFKETQLEYMRIGQPVTLEADIYSDVVYHGYVESLGVGTGSAFALLPAQNATGNWIKIVQRVPVRIRLDAKELDKHPLRIGLSMTVKVDLHDQSGAMLPQQPPTKPILSTDIYQQQLAEAKQLIDKIIEQNAGDSK